jgi:hypothetical protein
MGSRLKERHAMADKETSILNRLSHPRYLLFLAVLAISVWPLFAVIGGVEAVVTAFDLAVIAFVLS